MIDRSKVANCVTQGTHQVNLKFCLKKGAAQPMRSVAVTDSHFGTAMKLLHERNYT